jgi:hypothetical protein
VRIDAEEMHTPGGITMDEALKTAKLCEELGMDAISVSAYARLPTGSAFTDAPIPQKQNAYREFAAASKGGRHSHHLGRPLGAGCRRRRHQPWRDGLCGHGPQAAGRPDLANKLQANTADVRPCIYCYACVSEDFHQQGHQVRRQRTDRSRASKTITFAEKPKHVLIVGGGPSGMEAARVAALRGHRVTLVERSDRLAARCSLPPGLSRERPPARLSGAADGPPEHPAALEHHGRCRLLAELQPDEILVGTGARRAAPAIEGAQQSHVWSGDELRRLMTGDRAEEIAKAKLNLAERALFKAGGMLKVTDSTAAIQNLSKLWMPLGKRVVIIGAGLVGLELAEFLLDRGREVTVLDPAPTRHRAGHRAPLARVRRREEPRQAADAVQRHAHRAQGSRLDGQKGEEYRTPADSVVLAIGAEADSAVAEQLQSLTRTPVRRIGDCQDLGYIEGAMHSGHQAGREV